MSNELELEGLIK